MVKNRYSHLKFINLIIKDLNQFSLNSEENKEAIANLTKNLFPSRKEEIWKYTPFKKFKKINFHNQENFKIKGLDTFNLPNLDGIVIVFENGRDNSKLSRIVETDEIDISFSSDIFPSNNFQTIKKNNYFTSLNSSFLTNSVLVNVNSNTKISKNLNFINMVSSDNCLSNTKFSIVINDNSNINVRQYFLGNSSISNGFINHENNIYLNSSSSLSIDKFQDLNNNFNFCNEFITQKNDSKFIMNTFSCSGIIVRNDIISDVNGENCHTELNGVFSPTKNEHIDNHTTINHLVPNCKSFENYKGVLKENGVGVFNGKVIVHQDAQKIEAFQKNNNILIDQDSIIYSKPELEIYADDVKCSHGSTTGQFDDEALFYLRSRGLSIKKSLQLMTLGFINEVIQKTSNLEYVDFVLKRLLKE